MYDMYEVKILITSSFICIVNLISISVSIIIGFIGPMVRMYYCPRCKMKKVIEYPDSIVCPNCLLEFDKKQLLIFFLTSVHRTYQFDLDLKSLFLNY